MYNGLIDKCPALIACWPTEADVMALAAIKAKYDPGHNFRVNQNTLLQV